MCWKEEKAVREGSDGTRTEINRKQGEEEREKIEGFYMLISLLDVLA